MCICMNYGNDVNEFLYFKSDQEQYPITFFSTHSELITIRRGSLHPGRLKYPLAVGWFVWRLKIY